MYICRRRKCIFACLVGFSFSVILLYLWTSTERGHVEYLSPNYLPNDIDAVTEDGRKHHNHVKEEQFKIVLSSESQDVCGMTVYPHAVPKSRDLEQKVLPAVLIMYIHKTTIYRHIQRLCGFLRIKADLYSTQSTSGPILYRPSGNNVHSSTKGDPQGKYAIIVIVGLQVLTEMSSSKLGTVFSYARERGVPVVIVATDEAQLSLPQLSRMGDSGDVLRKVWTTLSSVNLTRANSMTGSGMGSASMRILPKDIVPFLTVTKSVSLPLTEFSGKGHNLALLSSTHQYAFIPAVCFQVNSTPVREAPLMLYDRGAADGVVKVLVGMDIGQFPFPLLFHDIATGLSPVSLTKFDRLKRYLMIDVDDTFHAPAGRQPTVEHVEKVLKFQESVRESFIKNFHLNLGFVGSGFERGTQEEMEGSRLLIQKREEFWWFPHTFRHVKCHSMNLDLLREEMQLNKEFADKHGLSDLVRGYSVAPFHAGVYPVHLPLYQAWREVWNVTVTTTEEYPVLQPSSSRRGFEYEGLRVLPRQTCGIYTKQTYFKELSLSTLKSYANGGQLFQAILFNPISVFMTHYNNYGGDQLAILLFLETFQFISKYTNLELVQKEPRHLAELYFQWYSDERLPVWTSPCLYQRHRDIWSKEKNCSRLPSLLIVGPQKTGSTAVHFFLQAHPSVRTSTPTEHFEEVQFFSNNDMYQKGIDWYMELFPYPGSEGGSAPLLFEKSASYFDSRLAARRAAALLPGAKIVAILDDPIRRAYSWYQHARAHNVPAAVNSSFVEVLRCDSRCHPKLIALRNKCLKPGLYAQHLKVWLQHYKSSQVYLIDGRALVESPVDEMNSLQTFLHLQPSVDFGQLIRFDRKKGFFCRVVAGGMTKCLGRGKGRDYPEMEREASEYLTLFYSTPNQDLARLLSDYGYQTPRWLAG